MSRTNNVWFNKGFTVARLHGRKPLKSWTLEYDTSRLELELGEGQWVFVSMPSPLLPSKKSRAAQRRAQAAFIEGYDAAVRSGEDA